MAATPSEAEMAALLMGPGLEPPTGVLPNFVNPYSYKDYILFTLILCLAMSTVLVAIRMYTRGFIAKSIGLEDCVYHLRNQSTSGWATNIHN